MSGHDHEYALTVRPNAYVRVAYSTDDNGLERIVVAVEYGRDGLDGDDTSGGIEWGGYEVSFARDGKTILGHGIGTTLDRNIERFLDRETPPVDTKRVLRGLDTASGYSSRVKARLGDLRDQRFGDDSGVSVETPETPDTIEIPGPNGTTIDVSLTGTEAAFELYEDGGGNWRWRLIHDDHGTLAVSPSGYDSRDAAEETIAELKANVLGAEIED